MLVAEDNPVNQEVAASMLAAVKVVEVDLVAHRPRGRRIGGYGRRYDLVFMDWHMPEMDGLEAARHIRDREESAQAQRAPIVALTASAMARDDLRCMEAGMDDYLSKPFTHADLCKILARWGGAGTREVKPGVVTAASAPADGAPSLPPRSKAPVADVLDARAIDRLRDMQKPGRSGFVERILGKYPASSKKLFAAIGRGVEQCDPEAIELAAHTLKSSSENVGALHVASLAASLEQVCHVAEPVPEGDSWEMMFALVPPLEKALDVAIEAVERFLTDLEANAVGPE